MNFQFPMNRRLVRESRPLDYIYDPIFTLPSHDFDNGRNSGRNQYSRMKFRKACKQSNLGGGDTSEQSLSYCDPMCPPFVISGDLDPHRIIGSDRAKFFIKYAPAFMSQNQLSFQSQSINMGTTYNSAYLNSGYSSGNFQMDFNKRAPELPRLSKGRQKTITTGTQTDFREMETQTDPYSPPYILQNPHDFPKVLALVNFTWGRGLPATLDDIVAIERALTRRLLELNTNMSSTDKVFRKRIRLMEHLEAQQWADRERALDNLKKLKQAVVNHQLAILHNRMSKEQTIRLERIFEKKKRENTKRFDAIRANYLRALRKLERKYTGQTRRKFKRDIILDYIDMESSIYAPLMRNGPNIDQLGSAPDYHFTAHHDYETLIYLTQTESFVKDHLQFNFQHFANRIDKLKPHRNVLNLEKKLQECYQAFKDAAKPPQAQQEQPLKSIIVKGVHRMSTPELQPCAELEQEENDEAVVLLQSLIRGHAVQAMMRKEATNNMEEILRIKALWESDPLAIQQTINEKLAIVQQQDNQDATASKRGLVQGVAAQLEGEVLFHIMRFLEQEMTRLLDERKIHALILMAERERRMIEAAEGGRRQREEECLRTNEEIWRETLGVHQQTVDMYLEDIYLEAVNRSASEESRRYVRQLASTINDAAHVMEKNIKDTDSNEIAADLVHSFLFPHAVREKHEQKLQSLHGRYYSVATQVTNAVLNSQGIVNDIIRTVGPSLLRNLQKGDISVDASYKVVEEMINSAVQALILQQKKCEEIREYEKRCEEERALSLRKPPPSANSSFASYSSASGGSFIDNNDRKEVRSDSAETGSEFSGEYSFEGSTGESSREMTSTLGPQGLRQEEAGEGYEDEGEDKGLPKYSVEFFNDLKKHSSGTAQEDDLWGSDPDSVHGESRKATLASLEDEENIHHSAEGATDKRAKKSEKHTRFGKVSLAMKVLAEEESKEEIAGEDKHEEEEEGEMSADEAKLLDVMSHYETEEAQESEAGEESVLASGEFGDLEDNEEENESDEDTVSGLDVQEEKGKTGDPNCIPIQVPEALPALLGLKAMELESGVKELGESAMKVYDAACVVTEELFAIVAHSFESSDEEPDVELDDDDPDED